MEKEDSTDSGFAAHMLAESPDLALKDLKLKQTYKLFLFMSGFIVLLALMLVIIGAPSPFYFLLLPLVIMVAFLYGSFHKRQKQAAWIRASISELHEFTPNE